MGEPQLLKGNVSSRIQAVYPTATKKEKEFVGKLKSIDKNALIYLSITELSEQTGIAEATIVRFCHKLDYKGYQDFKLHLSQDLAAGRTLVDGNVPEIISDEMVNSIRETNKEMNYTYVREVAEKIVAARRVCVFAVGNSALAGTAIRNTLTKAGLIVTKDNDSHIQAMTAANIGKEDFAVLVTVSGSTKDILDIAKLVKKNDVPVAVITNHFKSPVMQYADYRLYSTKKEAADNGGNLATIVSQLYIVDVLCRAVYDCMGPKARENYTKSNNAVSDKLL